MSKVIVHKKSGGTFETTEGNLANVQRLLAGNIASIERPEETQTQSLEDVVDDELVVDVTNNNSNDDDGNGDGNDDNGGSGLPTEKELMASDKDVLKKLADELAEKKGITKVNHRSGKAKLTEYILANQGE